ncbi:unnamed protein product [Linum tenue]|uniref:Protein ENHANCED DISEASE RESISTANCE 2 C-terminal domain-containing protein n=2 Tax=Linum tenue TaxID=586396 RepID=A0AAV0IJX0_9ROSI|nr:unnamed protein product [Linum tenue]
MEVVPVEQEKEEAMEGWLYVVRSNRIGLQYSFKITISRASSPSLILLTRKLVVLAWFAFCVLAEEPSVTVEDTVSIQGGRSHILCLLFKENFAEFVESEFGWTGYGELSGFWKVFCIHLLHRVQDPLRSAVIDSCIRVTDNGRENVNRKVLFIFTLFNSSNHSDQLKLGASSPEEAAKWIHSFQGAAVKGSNNVVGCSRNTWQSFRLTDSGRVRHFRSIDWTLCSTSATHTDPVNDVIAPSSWTIFGCQNGLRLFKETKDRDSHGKWDDHPAIMAVGVVDGSSESIFQTLMSLGPTRSEKTCFQKGLKFTFFLADGTSVSTKEVWLSTLMAILILFTSSCTVTDYLGSDRLYNIHNFILIQSSQGLNSYACYIIHFRGMKRRDLLLRRYWRREDDGTYALRELFKAKLGPCGPEFSSGELAGSGLNVTVVDVGTDDAEMITNDDVKASKCMAEEADNAPSGRASLGGLNDAAADEFFDVPEPSDSECWSYDFGSEGHSQDMRQPKLSTAAGFVKKLHDLAVQKRGYVDLQDLVREDNLSCGYGTTLPKDETYTMLSSWAMTDPSTFLIRGKNYLQDQKKIKARGTLMEMVAADWLKSDKREDDLAGRPGSIVQKYAAQGGPEFFLIINIQVPGSTTYSLALYFMMNTPLEDSPLLQSFVNGDDAFRNSRFKLIPYISKGSWIVKQSVGKKACLIGQALEMNYFRGKNYLELGVDIGSSTVARGVVSLVLGYLSNLVIEMAFLVQANTEEELPEYLLGTCRTLSRISVNGSCPQTSTGFGAYLRVGEPLFQLTTNHFFSLAYHICFPLVNSYAVEDGFGQCENVVKKWTTSALEQEAKEDKHTLRDLLFFLHVPRTGGRTYFHCFLKKLYSGSDECPRSYDKLHFDPSKQKCRLLVTHDDYSMISKLPKEKTSMVTILRNPVDRVFSAYEFSIEVAARFLVHPNLTSATQMAGRLRSKSPGMSTLDIWPWKYLVPWMREDLFSRRDARKLRGSDRIESNNPYSMQEIVMPLLQYINDPIARDIVHNGATFQKRLDDMLYVGLTEDHKESATMFANVVGAQVISQTLSSSSNATTKWKPANQKSGHSSLISNPEADHEDHLVGQTNTTVHSTDHLSDNRENMTVKKLMGSYEGCIKNLRKTHSRRRTLSLRRIAPANFSKTDRVKVPEMVLEEIRSLNQLDVELYEYARNIFTNQHQKSLFQPYDTTEGLGRLGSIFSNYSSDGGVMSLRLLSLGMFVALFLLLVYVNARRKISKVKI